MFVPRAILPLRGVRGVFNSDIFYTPVVPSRGQLPRINLLNQLGLLSYYTIVKKYLLLIYFYLEPNLFNHSISFIQEKTC